jgi:hypothetical protein
MENGMKQELSTTPSNNVVDGIESNDTKISTNAPVSAVARGRRFLPADYELDDNDVLCGRGSFGYNHFGNRHFRSLVTSMLEQYLTCQSRIEKSNTIFGIIDHIRTVSPKGGFVKKDAVSGLYYEVGDLVAVSSLC